MNLMHKAFLSEKLSLNIHSGNIQLIDFGEIRIDFEVLHKVIIQIRVERWCYFDFVYISFIDGLSEGILCPFHFAFRCDYQPVKHVELSKGCI